MIGVIAAYRMECESLVASIRLSSAADAAPIITRVQEGTVRGVSIGYRVTRWADSLDPITKARVRTAAAWAISEVSAVPIPADAGATFRSQTMPEDLIDNPAALTRPKTVRQSAPSPVPLA